MTGQILKVPGHRAVQSWAGQFLIRGLLSAQEEAEVLNAVPFSTEMQTLGNKLASRPHVPTGNLRTKPTEEER